MSSSDDEWRNPPDLLARGAGFFGKGAEDPMLAARKMALQRQRKNPAERFLLDGQEKLFEGNEPPASHSQVSFLQQQQGKEEKQVKTTGDVLQSLRHELETKKKMLLSAKSKEEALREWWRAQKAERLAEIAQLDGKLSRHQEEMEEMKAVAERNVREAEDKQQQRLKEERSKIEAEIREKYEPQIAAQRAELEELQEKEKRLKAELEVGDTAKDVVRKCISSALAIVLQRVQDMFAANTITMEDWEKEVQRLVRHEVRSSFAVTTDSEAQREREDYRKVFQELLTFWRKAEEEEKEYVLKMDEHMLLDMQAMVHDDFERLQSEEFNMEELFVESRNLWASQHQEVLKRELEAAMSRRAAELEEQREIRHQLHLERMKTLEEKHHEMLEKQRWFHEKQLALLREQHANEERLVEQRNCIMAATQADVSRATDEFKRILHSMEGVLQRIKEYRAAVDEGQMALNNDRQRELEVQEKTLTTLKDLVTSQTVSVGEEYNSLSATLSKLELVRRTVEQHLEEERMWLGKQEAQFAHEKAEWEREHRHWRQMVEDEKSHVQERFSRVLAELRNATEQLAEEERGAQTVRVSLTSSARATSEAAAAELKKLRNREEHLKERHDTMQRLVQDLQREGEQAEQRWRQLLKQQQGLAEEKKVLREDQDQLRLTEKYLQQLKEKLRAPRVGTTKEHEHTNTIQHKSPLAQNTRMIRLEKPKRKRTHAIPSQHLFFSAANNTDRLPSRVIKELYEIIGEESLHLSPTHLFHAHPQDTKKTSQQTSKNFKHSKQQSTNSADSKVETSTNMYDSSNYHFTNLLNFSDADTTAQSFHTTE